MNRESKINKLPEGWKQVRLGDYVKPIKGKKPKSISKEKTKTHSIPYVNIKAFEQGIIDEYTNGEGCILCEEGDFLMVWDGSRSGYVGKGIKGALGSTLIKLDFPNINNNYAFYFLQSKFLELNTKAKGVGIPHVDPTILWNYNLLIPSQSIQQAIVSKIEELFSELDKGIEQLKLAQQQLKIYRQAVLKWAFEGKLTNQKVNEGELPKHWSWKKLGELMESVRNGYSKKPHESGEFKILRISSVRPNKVDINDVRFLEEDIGPENSLEENDLLFTRYNGSIDFVGVCGRVPELREIIFYPDKLIRCRPIIKEWYHATYIEYASNSRLARQFVLTKLKTTAGQKGISGSDIKEIPIPVAPLNEQLNVVQEIESRFSISDKIEEIINQSLQQADALKQSILKKAFEGKLISTDTTETIQQRTIESLHERKILAGKIIFLLHDDNHFGLTKFQKTLYLVENFAKVPYETNYIREAAGPYDRSFTKAFRKEMQEKGWVHEEQKRSITKLIPGDNMGHLTKDYATHFRQKSKEIVFVIQLLKDKSTHEAELIATLYAAWNNRLIKKQPVKIKSLTDDFFNWSKKKKEEFQEDEIVSTYKWMKKVKLVPTGFGKYIEVEA